MKLFSEKIPLLKRKHAQINIEDISKENRENFIERNKSFIYSATYQICKRKLNWENDDELSIALIAFNKACDNYEICKGNFYSYAKIIIRNAIIDSFRKNKHTPLLLFDNNDSSIEYINTQNSLHEYELQCENKKRQLEIALFSNELKKYNITFEKLINACPKHKDTRNNLLNISFSCIKDNSIIDYIKSKKNYL